MTTTCRYGIIPSSIFTAARTRWAPGIDTRAASCKLAEPVQWIGDDLIAAVEAARHLHDHLDRERGGVIVVAERPNDDVPGEDLWLLARVRQGDDVTKGVTMALEHIFGVPGGYRDSADWTAELDRRLVTATGPLRDAIIRARAE